MLTLDVKLSYFNNVLLYKIDTKDPKEIKKQKVEAIPEHVTGDTLCTAGIFGTIVWRTKESISEQL